MNKPRYYIDDDKDEISFLWECIEGQPTSRMWYYNYWTVQNHNSMPCFGYKRIFKKEAKSLFPQAFK